MEFVKYQIARFLLQATLTKLPAQNGAFHEALSFVESIVRNF